MRKVFRARLRRSEGTVNLAADVDAAIAVNTGDDARASRTVVRSSHSVKQGEAGQRDHPEDSPNDPSGPSEEKQ
jgi:hypothetical protein